MNVLVLLFCAVSVSACGLPYEPKSAEAILVASGGTNHFAFAADLPLGQTLVSYSKHNDEVVADPVDAARVLGAAAVSAANFYLSGAVSLSAGIYAASYIATAQDSHIEQIHGWTSTDNGATWHARPGFLQLPEPPIWRPAQWASLLVHRRLHERRGVIVGTLYGGYERDRRTDGGEWYRSVWAESFDQGLNWRVRSVIAEGQAGTEGYGEPVSAFCADGRILVVMRTGPTTALRWARSGDDGNSWTLPRELPGMTGWDPDMLAVEGGVLLSWGITGQVHLAYSKDCGDSWRLLPGLDISTSSGYSGLALVRGRPMVFTDRANETEVWGYPIQGDLQ